MISNLLYWEGGGRILASAKFIPAYACVPTGLIAIFYNYSGAGIAQSVQGVSYLDS